MIIKLAQILDVEKPLSELMEQQLPLKLSFKLAKLVKRVVEELKEFYRLREELIKKLGEKGDDESYSIPENDKLKRDEFMKEILELAEEDVNIADFEPISISEFDGVDIKVTPMQMSALQVFFKE